MGDVTECRKKLGIVASGISGWAVYEEIGGDRLVKIHEFTPNAMLALVILQIAGVLAVSYLQRENLIIVIITGRKRGKPQQAISNCYLLLAMVLLMAVIGF